MSDHPYSAYENTVAWEVLEQAIADLVLNSDLQETTARKYIVGYLVKKLVEAGAVQGPTK